jgi:hypothetical protein
MGVQQGSRITEAIVRRVGRRRYHDLNKVQTCNYSASL